MPPCYHRQRPQNEAASTDPPAPVLRNQDRRPLAIIEEDRRRAISAADAAVAEFDAETFVATQLDLTNHERINSPSEDFNAATALRQMGMVVGPRP